MPNETKPGKKLGPSTAPIEVTDAAPMNPGDDAPAGTPGTGENICPVCNGAGRLRGASCANCGGSGRIVAGIGGA